MSVRTLWPYAFKCLLLMGLAGGVGGFFFYQQFERDLQGLLEEENLRATRLAARMLDEGPDLNRTVQDLAQLSDARITVVGLDGWVLADSDSDPSRMENHGDRPEVRGAMESGFAHAIRHSATLKTDMLYTAIRKDDETGSPRIVVRLARTVKHLQSLTLSFSEIVWTSIPLAVLLGVLGLYLLIELRIARAQRPL